jgi:hypothetical protein
MGARCAHTHRWWPHPFAQVSLADNRQSTPPLAVEEEADLKDEGREMQGNFQNTCISLPAFRFLPTLPAALRL